MTNEIRPETLDIEPGDAVITRNARGEERQKVATSGVVRGRDLPAVVWVCRWEEWEVANRLRREPVAEPWPAEDVWPDPDDGARTCRYFPPTR